MKKGEMHHDRWPNKSATSKVLDTQVEQDFRWEGRCQCRFYFSLGKRAFLQDIGADRRRVGGKKFFGHDARANKEPRRRECPAGDRRQARALRNAKDLPTDTGRAEGVCGPSGGGGIFAGRKLRLLRGGDNRAYRRRVQSDGRRGDTDALSFRVKFAFPTQALNLRMPDEVLENSSYSSWYGFMGCLGSSKTCRRRGQNFVALFSVLAIVFATICSLTVT